MDDTNVLLEGVLPVAKIAGEVIYTAFTGDPSVFANYLVRKGKDELVDKLVVPELKKIGTELLS